ncbi:MAG: hypothetical protein ACFE0P_10230 [Oceanicaulis sp.]
MATRSFVLAAALALFAAAAVLAWSMFGGGLSGFSMTGGGGRDDDRAGRRGAITINEGSLYDEFGEFDRSSSAPASGERIVINTARAPAGAGGFRSGPQFDWSGSRPDPAVYDLPRDTPDQRVEADCRIRGGSSYGCRCLVRLSRADLSEAEFAFLSLAGELSPRPERLQTSGLEAGDLGALAAKLVALDVQARRRCGAGLAP